MCLWTRHPTGTGGSAHRSFVENLWFFGLKSSSTWKRAPRCMLAPQGLSRPRRTGNSHGPVAVSTRACDGVVRARLVSPLGKPPFCKYRVFFKGDPQRMWNPDSKWSDGTQDGTEYAHTRRGQGAKQGSMPTQELVGTNARTGRHWLRTRLHRCWLLRRLHGLHLRTSLSTTCTISDGHGVSRILSLPPLFLLLLSSPLFSLLLSSDSFSCCAHLGVPSWLPSSPTLSSCDSSEDCPTVLIFTVLPTQLL